METDLSILFERPVKDMYAMLTIEPLAPLSIVSTLPGSYYKSLDKPTKANLCGVFENVLGWHIGPKDRIKILKKMKQVYKKAYKITELDLEVSAVGYTSLLGHLFDLDLPLVPSIIARYDDYWTQQLKHDDARHLKGTANLSHEIIKEKRSLPKDEKGKISDKTYTDFLKKNTSKFPMYYTSPTSREFIVLEGNYQIKLSMSFYLFEALKKALADNNLGYLGTNEGWVNLSLRKI